MNLKTCAVLCLSVIVALAFGSARAEDAKGSKREGEKPATVELFEFAIVADASDGVDLDSERKKLVSWVEKNTGADLRKFHEIPESEGGPKAGFRWVPIRGRDGIFPNGASIPTIRWELVRVEKESKLRFGTADLAKLKVVVDPVPGASLLFALAAERRSDFEAFTKQNRKRAMAWIVKGQIVASPVIATPLPGEGMIQGNLSVEELEGLVKEWSIMNEPAYIKVQHCLISFKGSLPKPTVTRSKEEAKKLAYEILEMARKGEDFDALVKKYTDDSHPGIYAMGNIGQPPKPNCYPRQQMVPAFGDTGFPLKLGELGIADFDSKKSPFGWHIVKRVE